MLALDKTMSTFDKRDWKKGQFLYMYRRVSIFSGSSSINSLKLEPTPYQPGNITRLCDQEKTQGIARKPPISVMVLRAAGREPILKLEIALIGLDSKK